MKWEKIRALSKYVFRKHWKSCIVVWLMDTYRLTDRWGYTELKPLHSTSSLPHWEFNLSSHLISTPDYPRRLSLFLSPSHISFFFFISLWLSVLVVSRQHILIIFLNYICDAPCLSLSNEIKLNQVIRTTTTTLLFFSAVLSYKLRSVSQSLSQTN